MSRVLNIAHQEWGIRTPVNPASAREVRRPKLGADAERNRTLAPVHILSSAEEVGARVAQVSGKGRLKRYEERLAESHRHGEYFDFHPDVAPLLKRPMSEYCAIMRAARYPHWFRPVPVTPGHAPLIVPGLRARNRASECRIWAIESFGIETAMRRGEMAKLAWDDVHLEEGYVRLPPHITKGKYERIVPLTLRAARILRTQPRVGALVFNATVESIERAHELVIARCGLRNLRFHDLRHEAVTRLVNETTLSPLQVGKITGHRDVRTLMRYNNPTPLQVVKAFRQSRR
jgi:integrase